MDMPDKYEREIEDILRKNVDRRWRPRESARRSTSLSRLNFSEQCLVIAIVAALFGGGWAYANSGGNLVTGFIGLIGVVCVALVALSSFIVRQRYSASVRGRRGPYMR